MSLLQKFAILFILFVFAKFFSQHISHLICADLRIESGDSWGRAVAAAVATLTVQYDHVVDHTEAVMYDK